LRKNEDRDGPHETVDSTLFLLIAGLCLSSCATRVKYSDWYPPTTATISGSTATINLGCAPSGILYSRLKIKIRGETVYIAGYNALRKHNSAATIQVPSGVNPQMVSVVWVNPAKSQVTVPITN
jgi:hypothetical protein